MDAFGLLSGERLDRAAMRCHYDESGRRIVIVESLDELAGLLGLFVRYVGTNRLRFDHRVKRVSASKTGARHGRHAHDLVGRLVAALTDRIQREVAGAALDAHLLTKTSPD